LKTGSNQLFLPSAKLSKRLSENMMPIGQKIKKHMPYLIIFQIKLLKQALFNMKTNAKLVLVLSY